MLTGVPELMDIQSKSKRIHEMYGTKPGHVYGQTGELGYAIANDPVHVHDFNVTLLHLLGINHERLTFRYQGRQFRLTDVHGKLIKGVLA